MALASAVYNQPRFATSIEDILDALLDRFGRSVAKFRCAYDIEYDTQICRAVVNLPWGGHTEVGAALPRTALNQYKAGDCVRWYAYKMFIEALPESDVKEEVANESLPIEALEEYEGIARVANTLVIQ